MLSSSLRGCQAQYDNDDDDDDDAGAETEFLLACRLVECDAAHVHLQESCKVQKKVQSFVNDLQAQREYCLLWQSFTTWRTHHATCRKRSSSSSSCKSSQSRVGRRAAVHTTRLDILLQRWKNRESRSHQQLVFCEWRRVVAEWVRNQALRRVEIARQTDLLQKASLEANWLCMRCLGAWHVVIAEQQLYRRILKMEDVARRLLVETEALSTAPTSAASATSTPTQTPMLAPTNVAPTTGYVQRQGLDSLLQVAKEMSYYLPERQCTSSSWGSSLAVSSGEPAHLQANGKASSVMKGNLDCTYTIAMKGSLDDLVLQGESFLYD